MKREQVSKSFFFGSGYSLISNFYKTLLNFAVIIVFARYLTPYDYAIAALAISVINIFRIFADFSYSDYVIHKASFNNNDSSSFFWMNILFSIFTLLIFSLIGNALSSFFSTPELTNALLVLSAFLLIESIGFQSRAQLVKNLRFKVISIIDIIASTIGIFASFILVLLGFEYWALIGVYGLKFVFSHIISFFYLEWRPKLEIKFSLLRESIGYCIPLVTSNVVMTITTAIKNGIINNFIGKAELGVFSKADKISVLPSMVIIGPLNRLVFPILTKFEINSKEFSDNYLYLARLVGYLSYPIATILVFFPSEFITILLGQNWIIAIPVFKGLSLACFAYCASNLCRWLFLTSGNTRRLFYVNIFRLLLFSGVISYFSKFGILAVAYAYSATELILRLPTIYYAKLGSGIKLLDIIKSQMAPIFTSLCAVFVPLVVWKKLDSDNLLIFMTVIPILYISIFVVLTIRQKFIKKFLASIEFWEFLKKLSIFKNKNRI